jgi:hypothetical protein
MHIAIGIFVHWVLLMVSHSMSRGAQPTRLVIARLFLVESSFLSATGRSRSVGLHRAVPRAMAAEQGIHEVGVFKRRNHTLYRLGKELRPTEKACVKVDNVTG